MIFQLGTRENPKSIHWEKHSIVMVVPTVPMVILIIIYILLIVSYRVEGKFSPFLRLKNDFKRMFPSEDLESTISQV
jgi:hypothetical protein